MMATASGRVRLDLGKVIMVPAAAVMLLVDLTVLTRNSAAGILARLGTLLVCAFFLLIIWCYLRRGPAIATCSSIIARVVAVIATLTPFAFPLLGAAPRGAGRLYAADGLLVAGTRSEEHTSELQSLRHLVCR